MAILNTAKKFMLYAQETTGHVLYKLASQCIEMDNGNDLQTEINTINNNLTYHVDSITNLTTTNTNMSSHILSIVIQGKIAHLSLKAKTDASISSWTNLLDTNTTLWLQNNATPQTFVNYSIQDQNGVKYFFKYVGDTPYFWLTNTVASGTELFLNCTWIIK